MVDDLFYLKRKLSIEFSFLRRVGICNNSLSCFVGALQYRAVAIQDAGEVPIKTILHKEAKTLLYKSIY